MGPENWSAFPLIALACKMGLDVCSRPYAAGTVGSGVVEGKRQAAHGFEAGGLPSRSVKCKCKQRVAVDRHGGKRCFAMTLRPIKRTML